MLNRVRLRSSTEETIDLYIGRPPNGVGFFVTEITGLGPVKADISYSNYSLIPGGVYNSSNTGVRNITLTVGIDPNYSAAIEPSQMRQELYSVAPPTENIRMYFYDDIKGYSYWIDGYVETMEPTMFSKTPSISISIICVETAFRSPDTITVSSTTAMTNTIELLGDYKHAFNLEARVGGSIDWFRVANLDTNQIIQVNKQFTAGQIIYMNLEKGYKTVSHHDSSGNVIENLMGYVEVINGWPEIRRGDNRIFVSQSSGDSSTTYDLTYRDWWGGI